MTVTSKKGEELNFLETGVDGIYVLDHVAFRDIFNEDDNTDWDRSIGKRKLREWAENNLPDEILEQFDVDLSTVEEVFSQKLLNTDKEGTNLKSRQFPIFQNSDNRLMEFNGSYVCWWTRSAYGGYVRRKWVVYPFGYISFDYVDHANGFVPVLRKKAPKGSEAECWERLKKVAEEYAQKHMHPHKTIIITQQGIELSEGEKASPFELLD